MPEARDRLSRRQDDPSALFLRQRGQFGSLHILPDEPATFRWGATPLNGAIDGVAATPGRGGGGGGVGRGTFRTPRVGNRRGRVCSGHENTPAWSVQRARGHGSRSILPSWYPRKPLQDITPIVKAIERRRARLREVEGLQLSSPLPQVQSVHSPLVPVSGAPLEHKYSLISPSPPEIRIRHCPPTVGKVPKILLHITEQSDGPSDFLTPEKKLLNSIDQVEKVVTQELNRLKRTPAAKRAEREKKVRTLMSMR